MKHKLNLVLKSPWFWAIFIGYILRSLLMPITGQHDVAFMPWMTHFINQGNWNLYAFLYQEFGDIVMHRPGVWAPYPYGYYLFTASWLEILERINLIEFAGWNHTWRIPYPARYVFLFKAIYIPFDLAIGYILYRISGRIGLLLWAWSPTAIYTPFMMGQNDIYVTAFAVSGIYAASKVTIATNKNQPVTWLPDKWAIIACILLGIGGAFKIYPLLLIPPIILMIETRWQQRFALFSLSCIIFAASVVPFLTTPTFIDGVLLNPEGSQIFREIHLFGVTVSPFLLSYIILFSYLIITPITHTPKMVWHTALIIIALLFLWTPGMFYWLIWITPFLIGAIYRSHKLVFVWFLLQIAFAITLANQHRELGVALPIHLAHVFNVPNLPTTIALTQPTLYRIFITLLPLVNSLLITALLGAVWFSIQCIIERCERAENSNINANWQIVAVIPTLVMMLILSVNLFWAKDLVSRNNWSSWQSWSLDEGEYIVQDLNFERKEIAGVRLRYISGNSLTVVTVCMYQNGEIDQQPLQCSSKSVAEQVENQILYFIFSRSVILTDDDTPVVKIEISNSHGEALILPYTNQIEHTLQFNETKQNGSLDISPLSSLKFSEAFRKLIVENILMDGRLLLIIFVTIALLAIYIAALLVKNEPFTTHYDE